MNTPSSATPLVVIVTGPPGAGKTILGRRLAKDLGFPFISKDDVKEILFETLGWEDRQWSMRLGYASFEILFHVVARQLSAGQSVVVETAFIPRYNNARFQSLREEYCFDPVQIRCTADEDVLFRRFVKRIESGERHPGHADDLMTYRQFVDLLRDREYDALQTGGVLLEVDTTDFDAINTKKLVQAIESRNADGA